MNLTPWFPPDTVPARAGYYLRDHRNVWQYEDACDRRVTLDFWEPCSKDGPYAGLYPGVWYVDSDRGPNDASQQHLPWCGLTEPMA